MMYRLILPAICLPLLSNCSANSPPAIEAAPPSAIVRPPCAPPPDLMAAPAPLAPLTGGDKGALSEAQAVGAWIDDMTVYQMLREQTQKLQAFIAGACQ